LGRGRLVGSFVALSWLVCATARADDEDSPRHFYFGRDYGSEALYNPVWVIVNRGFDELQLRPQNRNPFQQNYLLDGRNVAKNVLSPFKAIESEGWGRFTREELLPLSFTATTARWLPNYGLHLVGGGQTYAELREWYMAHDATAAEATVFSIATLYTAAFINESLENHGVGGFNTDCLADLYVFDSAGIILFSIEPMRVFFSKYLIVDDWSLQPAFIFPTAELHNQGNYYGIKLPIPFYERLRLFGYIGYSSMAGLSYKLDREYSLSLAAGGTVAFFENTSTNSVFNIVFVKPSAAVFFDRNESLLASFQLSDVQGYFAHLNVYPNAFFHVDPGLGFFTVVSRDGHAIVGLSFTSMLGLGIGAGHL
jgi:hypothetical protein